MTEPTRKVKPSVENINRGIHAVRVRLDEQKAALVEHASTVELINQVTAGSRAIEGVVQQSLGAPTLRDEWLIRMDIELAWFKAEVEHLEPHLAWFEPQVIDIEAQWSKLSDEEKKHAQQQNKFWMWIKEIKMRCEAFQEESSARSKATNAAYEEDGPWYGPDGPPTFTLHTDADEEEEEA